MFHKDQATMRSFVQLRIAFMVLLFGLFAIWMVFFGWAYYRITDDDVTQRQVQAAFDQLCSEIKNKTPYHQFVCPEVK